ncbi:uncharacterized protein LOC126895175 [Daktulosphaira vitifoliae]|uniref:uncharacterized protein LOC126895175 n=1 Tax=Daktulosphaira vitifoliae TaxID=58002 RepID=UPI0021A9A8E4|nr:uncharacterized protein LOC126895175 [Daktulosphaira vitifoliae]
MEFFALIFMTTVIFVLKPFEAEQYSDYRENYKNYIKKVVTHIRSQIGSNQIQNLKLKKDSIYITDLEKYYRSNMLENFFRDYYSNTISILNFKYTEILKNFLAYTYFIFTICKQFHDRNLSENFNCCVTSLVEEVKNSKTMFENLYNAMKFISYIDVRLLFAGRNMPNSIIDEIEFFQQYVLQKKSKTIHFDLNSLPILEDSESVFHNFNQFYTEALKKVNNLFKNNNIIDTSIKTDLISEIKECSNENDSYLVYLTCIKLNSFYNETIETWYKNLGFEQFLDPKTSKFLPQLESDVKLNHGIKALNIMLREKGWDTMDHINIFYNNKKFNVESIIKDPINSINFQIKKDHVLQLLRCRFTEIMKNYYTLLSTIFFICEKGEKSVLHNCLIQFYNSFNKSKIMFEGLLSVINTLKKSAIWNVSYNSHSNLQNILKWVKYFLNLLQKKEFSQFNNIDQLDMKNVNVQNLEDLFLNFRRGFYEELHNEARHMKIRCCMKKPFYNKLELVDNFRYTANIMNNPNIETIEIYLSACNYFNNFCKNVYNFCYEELGFKKVYFSTKAKTINS